MNKTALVQADSVVPAALIHPGEIVKDEMLAMNMTQKDLAQKLAISESYMSELLKGKKALTPHLALALEQVFGTSAQFWMNLYTNYQIDLIKSNQKQTI